MTLSGAAWLVAVLQGISQTPVYDLVIARGRVLDPATRFDAVAWVGVSGGVVQAVSAESLAGRDTIDASGLIVAPGCALPMNTPDATLAAVVKALGGPLKPVPGVQL